MEAPSNPKIGWLEKFSAWHLPVILLIALGLRLLYAFQADGNAFANQNDGIEAYEVATKYSAVEAQAIDRSHRIGQTQTVNAYQLIAPART